MLIIVSILKIIGGIIALLILLMVAVFTVPVFYRADIDYSGQVKIAVRLVFFLGILMVYISPMTEKRIMCRIFGIPLQLKRKKASGTKKAAKKKQSPVQKSDAKEKTAAQEKAAISSKAYDKKEKTVNTIQKEGIVTRLKRLTDSLKKTLQKIKDTADKLKRLKAIICDEDLRETFGAAKTHLLSLFKHVSPKKTDLVVSVGLEDPAETGFLLAAAASVYPLYARWMKIEPHFDEKIFQAEGSVRGRFVNFYVGWHVIKVLRHKKVRAFLSKYR